MTFAQTPAPPFVAVVFSSVLDQTQGEYGNVAARMEELAKQQPGFLGLESARDSVTGFGITVSYFRDDDAVSRWRQNAKHLWAQERGRQEFYKAFRIRVANVSRSYGLRD